MKNKIDVSIIIPVYNSERYIAYIIEDLLNQSYENFEIIVINDGSTDNSQEILAEFEKRDERVKVVEVKNAGVSEARNLGISLAKGDYIRFIDADDRINKDSVKNMVDIVKKDHEIDVVIGSFRTIPDMNYYYGEYATTGKQNLNQMAFDFLQNVRSFYYGVVWNKLYKRSIILNNHLKFDRRLIWCEDFVFNLQYYKCCEWFYFLPLNKNVYDYIQHETSATKSVKKLSQDKYAVINEIRKKEAEAFFEKVGMSELIKLEWKYSFLFGDLLIIASKKDISTKQKYIKMKKILMQPEMYEYVKHKADYFKKDTFYRFTFWVIQKKRYIFMYIYISIFAWFSENMKWAKGIWKKLGGRRPKVL